MYFSYIFLIAFFLEAYFVLIFGLYVLRNNFKRDVGQIFMGMVVCVQFWSIGLAIATSAPTLEISIIWRRVASIGWGVIYSLILHFFLILTGKSNLLKKSWSYFIIYVPAVVNLFVFTIPIGINPIPYQLVHTSLGWINIAENNIWDWFFYVYYSTYTILGLILVFLWGKNSLNEKVKKQANLILKSFIFAFIISTITDIILNSLSIRIPQMAPIIMLIPIAAISYSIKYYGMLRTNQKDTNEIILSDNTLEKVFNYLFIIFLSGSLVNLLVQYLLYKEGSIFLVLCFSTFLIIIALLSKLLNYINLSSKYKESILSFIIYITIPIITLNFIEFGAITIWAISFVLIIVSLLFDKHTILLSVSLSTLFTQAFVSIKTHNLAVQVSEADYFARIFLLTTAIILSYFVNKIYVLRLKENSYQMRFQNLLSSISYDFVSVNETNFDEKMHGLLKDIASFIQIDRAYTILLNEDFNSIDYKCEWINDTIESGTIKVEKHPCFEDDNLDNIYPWLMEQLSSDKIVKISDIELLPKEDDKKKNLLKIQNIRALISIPIRSENKIVGCLVLNSFKPMNFWNLRQITPLEIIVNIISDAYIKVKNEKKINFMAYYDQLTKLPNRLLFRDRANQAIKLAVRNEKIIGIIFIDLDSFKSINDTFGHELGDGLLIQVSDTLSRFVRNTDTVSRFGGDEFIVMLNNISNTNDVTKVMDKIMSTFRNPIILNEHEVFVTASAGVALFPIDGEDVETLIKNADIAMYNSKILGKNRYTFCSTGMKNEVIEKMKLTNLLYRAQERKQLLLHYQPQISLRNNQIIGLEALARWNLPEWGIVPPLKFIPLAEQTGLINTIGEWVLRTACYQNKLWQDMGLPKIRMAVNVSINQLRNPKLVSQIDGILKETKLDAKYLELEITESIASSQVDNFVEVLTNLKGLGVSISIDDFGTEYSSLSRLKMLPIDRIKMDMQFIQGIEGSDKDKAITKVIINLAKSLNLKVIAEGVETMPQLDFLNQKMCDEVQGYYFYKPMPAEQIEKVLLENLSVIEKR